MIQQSSENFLRGGEWLAWISQRAICNLGEVESSLWSPYLEAPACQMLLRLWKGAELGSKDKLLVRATKTCFWKDTPGSFNIRHHSLKYQHTQL